MKSKTPDVTAILNVHQEGLVAHNSFQSIKDAKRVAAANNIHVEIIIAADCPNKDMIDYLCSVPKTEARILELNVDDLGLARNAAVAKARGRFCAFLDGDDLWGSNWLLRAYLCAVATSEPTVWHPEANLYFGHDARPGWMVHHDIDTERGDWVALGIRNHWTSLSFCPREVLVQVPYRKSALGEGFGYEDWCWNCETVSHGVLHRTVPGTAHIIRMKSGSLVQRTNSVRALPIPFSLFRNRIGKP